MTTPTTPRRRAKPQERELQEQKTLVDWVRLHEKQFTLLSRLFAIPNGGARSLVEGAKIKASGGKSGAWDLQLAVIKLVDDPAYCHGVMVDMGRRAFGSLFIEMKDPLMTPEQAEKALTPGQVAFRDMLKDDYAFVVANSWFEAAYQIALYLEIENEPEIVQSLPRRKM